MSLSVLPPPMARGRHTTCSQRLRRLCTLLLVPAVVHGLQSVLAVEPTEDALERDAPFIFNSVHSLLRQWVRYYTIRAGRANTY